MQLYPKTRKEWLGLVLFPFRAYLIIALICFFVWDSLTAGHRVRGARAEAGLVIVEGYMVCSLIFFGAAFALLCIGNWKSALKNLGFALLAAFIVALLLPVCAT